MSDFLQKDFERAQKRVWELKSCSNNNKLKIYGLFKQATVGNINTPEPSGWLSSLKTKAKWEAWKGNEGLTRDVAKREYIKLIRKLFEEENS